MNKLQVLALCAILLLAACAPNNQTQSNSQQSGQRNQEINARNDARLVARIYWIEPADQTQILYRFLDAVNAIRASKNLSQTQLSPYLIAAARTHSRDMSVQNRPWHFGSDGSSPIDRVNRAGFNGKLIGENISESFESEIETLSAWMNDPVTSKLILNPEVTTIGIGWFQELDGKIWWTFMAGA